jgi:hypothetical protein
VAVAVAPGGGVAVAGAVAPGGGVAVAGAVAPGGGVAVAGVVAAGVLLAAGVAVAPVPGRVGVSVGTVWKSGDWAGSAHAPGITASSPRTNRPTTAEATARDTGKRLWEVRLRGDGIGYCPIAGRRWVVRTGCHKG